MSEDASEDLKARLLTPRLTEEDVPIPGIGVVRVRALDRIEAIDVQEANETAERDRRIVSHGLVNPPMTAAEVGRWQKSAPAAELDPVANKISELSGMLRGAPKEAYKSLRGESGS